MRSLLQNRPVGADLFDVRPERNRLDFLHGLEFFIPEVLRGLYTEWDRESLDGFLPPLFVKCAENEVDLFGLCILISDQTVTPIHVQLQVRDAVDEVSWLDCRLGEMSEHGMIRTPYREWAAASARILALGHSPERIDWVYRVGFGKRIF
ncbi:MAG TPA: hypothetical protein VGP63_16885 [Planctomycetaceae bacterium]|nr:hypothetical protein [Planctomycetaceae bacterium]